MEIKAEEISQIIRKQIEDAPSDLSGKARKGVSVGEIERVRRLHQLPPVSLSRTEPEAFRRFQIAWGAMGRYNFVKE